MEAKNNPAYLQAISDALVAFRAALVDFPKLHEVNECMACGIAPAVLPNEKAKFTEAAS